MLVKRAVAVHLIDNVNLLARTSAETIQVGTVVDKHVEMVAILAQMALARQIAIGVVHRHAPRLALRIPAAARATLRILYREVVAAKRNVTLLVVASLLLSLRRSSRSLRLRRLQTLRETFSRFFLLV